MQEKIVELYNSIMQECGMEVEDDSAHKGTYAAIKEYLRKFTESCQNPAIWCYGNHTKMLMADFIFELKKVKYIIDNNLKNASAEGFEFIGEEKVREKEIDGIIISSYKYRKEIKKYIKENLPGIFYLDIYECLETDGIKCMAEYYNRSHPYDYYRQINSLKRRIMDGNSISEKYNAYEEIIKLYVYIKDFKCAIERIREYLTLNNSEKYQRILDMVEELYAMQKNGMQKIASTNVVMLCLDGLRRSDVSDDMMPNFSNYLKKEMIYFDNAYSISTSTYESLIPAYSENVDLKSRYYEKNYITEDACSFIQVALRQHRKIFFYTDTIPFIKSKSIVLKDNMQTSSEKMWDFLLDAVDEDNGLFYIHVLYESHFSYPNPYTNAPLIAEGTSIFFDFLPVNGGQLKTDYEQQHRDALHYLDDTLIPLISKLNTNMLIFADHGNVILKENASFNEITYPMLTFSEDLIEVPMAIRQNGTKPEINHSLTSLIEMNNIIISLLQRQDVLMDERKHIKVQRSRIYNPDFQCIYKKLHFEKGLAAFELFVFDNGLKLAVYEDGEKELYDLNDNLMDDMEKLQELYFHIEKEITVLPEKRS